LFVNLRNISFYDSVRRNNDYKGTISARQEPCVRAVCPMVVPRDHTLILPNTTVSCAIKTNRRLCKPTEESQEKGKIPHPFGKRATKQFIISCTRAQK